MRDGNGVDDEKLMVEVDGGRRWKIFGKMEEKRGRFYVVACGDGDATELRGKKKFKKKIK